MFVKICANTNLPDAQLAAELGADAVGFVFAHSRRQVTADQVAAITPHLPDSVLTVGVFATTVAQEILLSVKTAGLRGVQLHGAPDERLIEDLNCGFEGHVQLIQAVSYAVDPKDRVVADRRFVQDLQTSLRMPAISAVLLDASRGSTSGGLGVTFDWKHVAALIKRLYDEETIASREFPKLIVAGGLRAENVNEAVTVLQPWGVDVASGVEASPGKKDPHRLREFLAAARRG